MTTRRAVPYRELESRAHERLRGAVQRPKRGRLIVRAIVLPALRGTAASWQIFQLLDHNRRPTGRIAVHASWDKEADKIVIESSPDGELEPTLVISEHPLDEGTAAEIDSLLARWSVPVAPERYAPGLDGVTRILQFGEGHNCSTFTWWHTGPPSWRVLHEGFATLWAILNALKEREGSP